jgi:hypothetical protein
MFDQSSGQEGTDATMIQHAFKGRTDDMIRWGLVAEDIILEMAHDLRGDTYNEETKKWTENTEEKKMLCNGYCINKVSAILRFHIGKNTYLSNIEKDEMDRILFFLGCDMAELVYCEFENLGIKKQDMNMVLFGVLNLCEFGIRRAIGEGERKYIQTIRAVIEKVMGGEDKKDEGIKMPRFFGGGGGAK